MDNVHGVAVVDAREHLLHQDSCVSFCELASGYDLVEKLSSFANPILGKQLGLLCHNVVTLFIFKELIHLHNVRVVLSYKSELQKQEIWKKGTP